MATQQDIIKQFMHSLDETTLRGTAALDEAVRACSSYRGMQDLINHFVSDAEQAGDWRAFLRNACGIDLDNDDTGAITGSDAGGAAAKTAESIVPETWQDTWMPAFNNSKKEAAVTIDGLKFVVAKDYDTYMNFTEEQQIIICGLCTWWLKGGIDLIRASYGMDFSEGGTTVRTMDLVFDDDAASHELARVQYRWNPRNGKATGLTLHVNLAHYRAIKRSDVNGEGDATAGYLDRTIAHELTHAVMAANISYIDDMPHYIMEGMAELTHGIDDFRESDIITLARDPGQLTKWLRTDCDVGGDGAYSSGYMLLRYLAKQASGETAAGGSTSGTQLLADGTTYIDGGTFDVYIGGSNASRIQAGSRETAMWGGGAASDTFVGGDARDYYWIGTGDGQDTAIGFKREEDVIYAWSGTPVSAFMLSGSDLIMSPDAGQDTLTLKNVVNGDVQAVYIGRPNETQTDAVSVGYMDGTRTLAATNYSGTSILIGDASAATVLYAAAGDTAMWGGGSHDDMMFGSDSGKTYYWFGYGDGDDTVAALRGGDTVYLWNVDDISAVSLSENSYMTEVGEANAQLTLTSGDTLSVTSVALTNKSSIESLPTLQLANGETYRIGRQGSSCGFTRIS